jgi:hypothetical protein
MYQKHGRHNIDVVSANNEEQFATQFYNFIRKYLGVDDRKMHIFTTNIPTFLARYRR